VKVGRKVEVGCIVAVVVRVLVDSRVPAVIVADCVWMPHPTIRRLFNTREKKINGRFFIYRFVFFKKIITLMFGLTACVTGLVGGTLIHSTGRKMFGTLKILKKPHRTHKSSARFVRRFLTFYCAKFSCKSFRMCGFPTHPL